MRTNTLPVASFDAAGPASAATRCGLSEVSAVMCFRWPRLPCSPISDLANAERNTGALIFLTAVSCCRRAAADQLMIYCVCQPQGMSRLISSLHAASDVDAAVLSATAHCEPLSAYNSLVPTRADGCLLI